MHGAGPAATAKPRPCVDASRGIRKNRVAGCSKARVRRMQLVTARCEAAHSWLEYLNANATLLQKSSTNLLCYRLGASHFKPRLFALFDSVQIVAGVFATL
jgi:hypothetical protein